MNNNWFEELDKEERVREFKFKVRRKANQAKEWVIRNKDTLIAVTPIVIGCIATMTKVVGKSVNLHKEESVKNRYCYDNSLGHYWHLRRSLSNKEWLEIDRRKSSGERLANILADMDVLK